MKTQNKEGLQRAHFKLKEAEIKQLDDLARSKGLTRSQLIREFIHRIIEDAEDETKAD